MSSISCSVINCSHNDFGLCYANQMSIYGKKSRTSSHTCCTSFLDETRYGNLTDSTNDDCLYSTILCNVKTCIHNIDNACTLDNIYVTSQNVKANLYSEIYCSSFNSK